MPAPGTTQDGRPSEEPARTTSANPSTFEVGDLRSATSGHQNSSAQMRPTPIDQSSIIKNGDESGFNNNLNIFPPGTNHPAADSHSQPQVQPPSGTFPTVTHFPQKENNSSGEQLPAASQQKEAEAETGDPAPPQAAE